MFKLCVVCVFVIYRIVGQQSRGFLPKNIDVEKTGTCTRSIIDSTHDSQTKQKQRGKKNHLRLCLFFNFFCFCGHFNFSFFDQRYTQRGPKVVHHSAALAPALRAYMC